MSAIIIVLLSALTIIGSCAQSIENVEIEIDVEGLCPLWHEIPDLPAILFPHPECHRYKMCVPCHRDSCLESFPCPSILHFNPTTKLCDFPYNAGCGEEPDPPGEYECNEWFNPSDPSTYLRPQEDNCSVFVSCINIGRNIDEYTIICPDGLHFNRVTRNCDFPYTAGCMEPPSDIDPNECNIFDSPFESKVFPHETNCSLFYKCFLDEKRLIECPPNMHFHKESLTCVSKFEAQCEPINDQVNEQGCPIFDDPMIPTLLPNPNNCNSFFKCAWGVPIEIKCPNDWHFDPINNWCDEPEAANCVVI